MTTDSKGQFQPGYVIDKRYRILGFLGAGGFASVYRAMHEGMQREVAIKVMEKCDDESFIERFKREATLAGSIQNPCIVTIYDCGVIEETGQLYTAMELLHGHDLEEELMERGPLSPHRMYTLIRPVLDALGEGHAQGIVHKDLKPANLFLNDPGGDREYLKVLDFGVARKTTDQKLTTTGQMMGTVLYLAPEYINNSQNVSPAIDVYQMALIISELLTGKPCVEGETYSILMKHCMGEIQLADFLREGPAAEVFARATCVRPEKRYQNCTEFGEALESIADYFDSDVPLCGGEAQTVSRTSEKMSGFAAKKTSTNVTQSPASAKVETPETKPTEAPQTVKTKTSPVVMFVMGILVSIVVLFGIFIAIGKSMQDESAGNDKTQTPDSKPQAASKEAPQEAPKPEAKTDNAAAPAADASRIEWNEQEKKLWLADREVNPRVAILQQAAEKGDDKSWANLGIFYHDDPWSSELDMFDAFMHIQNIDKLDESEQKVIYFYIGKFLYERQNSPKIPTIPESKYDAVDCFRKAVKMRNIECITYLYENDLLDMLGLEKEALDYLDGLEIKSVDGETAYLLGILYQKMCDHDRNLDDCHDASEFFKRASDQHHPRARAMALESTICEFSNFNLKALEKLTATKSEECGNDDCREANRILIEWAISYYNGTLSERCWNNPKAVPEIEKYFSKSMSKTDFANDLSNRLSYVGEIQWSRRLGRELRRMIHETCQKKGNMNGFLEVGSMLSNAVILGNRRRACDVFNDMYDDALSCKNDDVDDNAAYEGLMRCYRGAIDRGQLYAPFKGVEDGPSTENLLLNMRDIAEDNPHSGYLLRTHIPAILYAAKLNDGLAQTFLGSLYRDKVPEGLKNVFSPDAERACYWDRLAAKSDFCKQCRPKKGEDECKLCAASIKNVQTCP